MKRYNFLPARKSFELLERHIDRRDYRYYGWKRNCIDTNSIFGSIVTVVQEDGKFIGVVARLIY